jgi:hypothetical protein
MLSDVGDAFRVRKRFIVIGYDNGIAQLSPLRE